MARLKLVLMAAAIAVLGSLGGAVQAQASQSQCPDGYLCLWEDPGFSGGFFAHEPLSSIGNFGAYQVDGRFVEARTFDSGHPLDNAISSLWNRTSLIASFWPGKWWVPDAGEGCTLRTPPGGMEADLARGSGPGGSGPSCTDDVFSSFALTDY